MQTYNDHIINRVDCTHRFVENGCYVDFIGPTSRDIPKHGNNEAVFDIG